jgi:hypothetical protein
LNSNTLNGFQFYIGRNYCLSLRQHFKFFLAPQSYLLFPCFLTFLVLVQIRRIYYMLHITSYHHYSLAEIHHSQGYFNMSCHWHMNMKWVFYVWAWTYFFSFVVITLTYTPSDVHLIMCALCEKKQLKELMDQKEKMFYFPMFLKILVTKLFWYVFW